MQTSAGVPNAQDAGKGRNRRNKWLARAFIFGPLLWITVQGFTGGLGANPIENVLNRFGWWALVMLVASLACTPLQRLTGWGYARKLRKKLGVAGFGYATLHLLTYLGLDRQLDLSEIGEDLTQRPFIIVGMLAFVLLVPLALTSTRRLTRRLGPRRWQRLHYLAYATAPLGVVHFWMRVKADLREPIIFAVVLAVLLGARVVWRLRRGRAGAAEASDQASVTPA